MNQCSFMITVKWDDAMKNTNCIIQAGDKDFPYIALRTAAENLLAAAARQYPQIHGETLLVFDTAVDELAQGAKRVKSS